MSIEKYNDLENLELSDDVKTQLENLDLNLNQIKGDILDIGAGEAHFAEELSKITNSNIVSVDNQENTNVSENIIISDIRRLSFEDNSFDLVISHASIPNVFIDMYSLEFPELSKDEIKKSISKSFKEVLRVLKTGSVAIMAPIRIAENHESEKALATSLREVLQEIESEGAETSLELIKEAENPVNMEKYNLHRLTILKK